MWKGHQPGYTKKWDRGLASIRTFAMVNKEPGAKMHNSTVRVTLTFLMPDWRRRDVHNYEELLFDALEGVCYTDDWFVCEHHCSRAVDRKNPRVIVEIEPVEEER